MINRVRWTKEEDNKLLEIISISRNKSKAFKEASRILQRSETAITARYYNHLVVSKTGIANSTQIVVTAGEVTKNNNNPSSNTTIIEIDENTKLAKMVTSTNNIVDYLNFKLNPTK